MIAARLRHFGITGAFVSVTTLFFAWGFITSNNDPLIVALRAVFRLNYTEALLTQLVFFLAYGLFSLPAASLGNRFGPLPTIIGSLVTTAEPRDRETAHRSFCAMLGHWQLRGWGALLVEDRRSDELVGCVGISDWEGWPEPEIGWWTVPPAWGHGYATEAARAALHYFASLKRTTRLVSFIPTDNARSLRVAEKLGAVYERDLDLHGNHVRSYVHTLE